MSINPENGLERAQANPTPETKGPTDDPIYLDWLAQDGRWADRYNADLITHTRNGYPAWRQWADTFPGLHLPPPAPYKIPNLVRGERRSDGELHFVDTGVPCWTPPEPPFVSTRQVNNGFVYVGKIDGMYRAPLIAMTPFGGGVYDESQLVKL